MAVESVLTFVTLQILLTAAEVLSLQGSVGEIIYFENSESCVSVTSKVLFVVASLGRYIACLPRLAGI